MTSTKNNHADQLFRAQQITYQLTGNYSPGIVKAILALVVADEAKDPPRMVGSPGPSPGARQVLAATAPKEHPQETLW